MAGPAPAGPGGEGHAFTETLERIPVERFPEVRARARAFVGLVHAVADYRELGACVRDCIDRRACARL